MKIGALKVHPSDPRRQAVGEHRRLAVGGLPTCKSGKGWEYLPFVGCKWQESAKQGLVLARQAGQDWVVGVKYLVRVGREDGLAAALHEADSATIFAAVKATGWTAQEVTDLLNLVDRQAVATMKAKKRADTSLTILARENPGAAAALRKEYRGTDYVVAREQLAGRWRDLTAKVNEVNPDLQAWADRTAKATLEGRRGTRFGAVQAIPPATAAVIIVAIAALCFVILRLLQWLEAREEELTLRTQEATMQQTQTLVSEGKLPIDALWRQQEIQREGIDRLRKKYEERRKETEARFGWIPWAAGAAIAVAAAPAIREAVVAWRMSRSVR